MAHPRQAVWARQAQCYVQYNGLAVSRLPAGYYGRKCLFCGFFAHLVLFYVIKFRTIHAPDFVYAASFVAVGASPSFKIDKTGVPG